jgi:hypothetical protein
VIGIDFEVDERGNLFALLPGLSESDERKERQICDREIPTLYQLMMFARIFRIHLLLIF